MVVSLTYRVLLTILIAFLGKPLLLYLIFIRCWQFSRYLRWKKNNGALRLWYIPGTPSPTIYKWLFHLDEPNLYIGNGWISPFPSILNWLFFWVPGKMGPRFDGGLLGRAMITGIRSFLDPVAVSRSLQKPAASLRLLQHPCSPWFIWAMKKDPLVV